MGVSTELWRLRIGCFTMPRKCKLKLRTLKPVPINLVIRLVLFYLLVVEGGPQTGSTRGNSSPRGSPRGHGCNGRRSGYGSRQDTINDAFADTSVCDHADLSNRIDPPYTLGRASRSQNQPSATKPISPHVILI